MLPSYPVQKTQNNLVKVSWIMGLSSVLAAALFHFFLYFHTGGLDNTTFIILVSTPFVMGIFSLILGMISLGQIMTNNIFGKGKAITAIVLEGVIVVGLIMFLFYLFLEFRIS